MKTAPARWLLATTIIAAAAATLSAQNYFQQYAREPLQVQLGGRSLSLIGLEGGDLVLRPQGRRRELRVPMDSEGLNLQIKADERGADGISAIRKGNYEDGVNNLRHMAYPMLRYASIPPERTNLHLYLERFLFALTQTDKDEHIVEAYDLFNRLDLGTTPPSITQLAITIVEDLAAMGRPDDALSLIGKIPLDGGSAGLAQTLTQIARNLRQTGDYPQALALYERVLRVGTESQGRLARLWVAYCNAKLGNNEKAAAFLNSIGEMDVSERGFSLKMLIEGELAIVNGDWQAAMRKLSRGLVFADISYDWTAELTFNAARAYEELENTETAAAVYREVGLLFPNSDWNKKAAQRLQALPKTDS